MLLPADLSVNPPPFVSSFQPDGSGLFQLTNQLKFVVESSGGNSTGKCGAEFGRSNCVRVDV